jgi:hypothetical protein
MADNSSAAADSGAKQRIITHMNNDHQDSLIRYLEHFCHLSSSSARHAKLNDITFDHLVVSTHKGSTHIIPIQPPMTSWSEARPRFVAMDSEAVAGLDRSNITVKKFLKPTGVGLLHSCVVAIILIVFPRRENLQPGSLVYDNILVYTPGFARLCLALRGLTLFLILGLHSLETVYMHTSRLRKHTVPTFSALWWKWVASTLLDGYPAIARFNSLIEEESKRTKVQH